MAKQGAIGFAHLAAHPLPLHIVGFDQVERDHAAVMTGQDLFLALLLG